MGETKKTATAGHKALYRKYRSKSLSEIVGQEHITKTLENALKQNKLSHAYLFTGPRGTGKTSIARILAHEINDLPYADETTHLDIIEIDAASNRRIDDIRDLRDKVHIAPTSAKYKVYIIDEVHMLTTESFNALLKTLEEPPKHVIFILATTEVHKLPATIISRTQRHGFRLISTQKVAEHLKYIAAQEGLKIDDKSLELLAQYGGGSFRDSISLLDQMSSSLEPITTELVELVLGLAPQNTLQELLQAVLSGNGAKVITLIETLIQIGLTPPAVATQLLSIVRNQIKSGENSDILANLMSDLLSVQSAQYPQLKLETILLSIAPPILKIQRTERILKQPTDSPAAQTEATKKVAASEIPKEKNTSTVADANDSHSSQKVEEPKVSAKEPEENTQILEQPKTKVKKTKPAKAVALKDFSTEEHWPKVLEIVKQKNNPLYTVLRMATPVVEGEELLLFFSFGFHQKKIEEAKYKAVIAEILQEVTGSDIPFQAIIDKARAKPANSLPSSSDPATASLINSVQDIMGGGEVVNV